MSESKILIKDYYNKQVFLIRTRKILFENEKSHLKNFFIVSQNLMINIPLIIQSVHRMK